MNIYAMSLGVLGFLVLFFVGLVLAYPLGWWLSIRLDSWPDRPMDNQERRARWALKYHQATAIRPNTHRWPWVKVERHGTGFTKADLQRWIDGEDPSPPPISPWLGLYATAGWPWTETWLRGSWDLSLNKGNDNE